VVPGEFVRHVSEGRLSYDIPVRVNRRLVDGGYDRIISIGQLVPHEVIGIANHNKNWLVGLGGDELIAKTHYLGAVFGMERIMGRARSPVRDVLDFASERLAAAIPITYLLTVRSMDAAGTHVTRGLFAGEGLGCYRAGAELSQVVNVTRLDRPIRTAVAWLDPGDYRSCWLANKAIYRLRMAMADGGELVVIAPGVRQFGEQPDLDRLIRRHGYRGTPATMEAVARDVELAGQLAAAAHLIHGSSEGRFTITYATPHLSRPEIEGVGFRWADPAEIARRYPLDRLAEGWNTIAGGEVFLTRHPGGGLWTV
jgi:nickel-dependent lactate racemase